MSGKGSPHGSQGSLKKKSSESAIPALFNKVFKGKIKESSKSSESIGEGSAENMLKPQDQWDLQNTKRVEQLKGVGNSSSGNMEGDGGNKNWNSLAMEMLKSSQSGIAEEKLAVRNSDTVHSTTHQTVSALPANFISLNRLVSSNKTWASAMVKKDPDFFKRLSEQQAPKILWIGCSDSRVPANQILSLAPGEIFVHRNIANIVHHSDLNLLSVLQYAVDVLKVEHVMVVGHYSCGGVGASMKSTLDLGLLDIWVRPLKDLYEDHAEDFKALKDDKARNDLLCELNVSNSVVNLCRSAIMQKAWVRKQIISVHGWVYRITDGILHDLNICISSPKDIELVHQVVESQREPHKF